MTGEGRGDGEEYNWGLGGGGGLAGEWGGSQREEGRGSLEMWERGKGKIPPGLF